MFSGSRSHGVTMHTPVEMASGPPSPTPPCLAKDEQDNFNNRYFICYDAWLYYCYSWLYFDDNMVFQQRSETFNWYGTACSASVII